MGAGAGAAAVVAAAYRCRRRRSASIYRAGRVWAGWASTGAMVIVSHAAAVVAATCLCTLTKFHA
eukprot:350352-Chlamydomonas_euryale.AAC.3